MITLEVNGKTYPVGIQPMEWMSGSEWVTHPMVSIPDKVSAALDRDHWPDFQGFIADTIIYAMVEGWTCADVMRQEDPELPPIHWAILVDGHPIDRDGLQAYMESMYARP